MLNIEYKENLEEEFYKIIDDEFNKFAVKNEVVCNYTPFSMNIVISILEVNLCKLSKIILKEKVLKI